MASKEELDKLSQVVGIDLAGLKEKYSSVQREQKTSTAACSLSAEEQERTEKALDAYQICKGCNGSGLMVVVYNHISTEKNCTACGGEGLLTLLENKVAAIVATTTTS